jgi:hypothetical protein
MSILSINILLLQEFYPSSLSPVKKQQPYLLACTSSRDTLAAKVFFPTVPNIFYADLGGFYADLGVFYADLEVF